MNRLLIGDQVIKREIFNTIIARLREKRRFMQVLLGPRQVGKTTLAHQVMDEFKGRCYYISADEPSLKSTQWLQEHWEQARRLCADSKTACLIIDEVQKADNWSEAVKTLWDRDTLSSLPLQVVLLGSSPFLVQKGLTESLAGRFETIPITHWYFHEMKKAFGWDLEQYAYFGGYPGAAELIHDPFRWKRYILDSLIEITVSRDLLLMTRVDKPALLRRLFFLGCEYSGQVLSYQKMVGQLQDVSNTTTLAHYLDLLSGAGLITGLQKYSAEKMRRRSSSPKLAVFNTALISALGNVSFKELHTLPEYRGRLIESTILAHTLNAVRGTDIMMYYWLDRNREVDMVLQQGNKLLGIEIKSGQNRYSVPGLEIFKRKFPDSSSLLVGGSNGVSITDFLSMPLEHWLHI